MAQIALRVALPSEGRSLKIHLIAIVGAAAALLSACETTTSLPYSVSTQNVIQAQSALRGTNGKVSVGVFTAAAGVTEPTCRAMGALDVAPGKDIPTYIRDAFEAELFMAQVHAIEAPAITGRIDSLEMNSFGTGSWVIAMTVSSTAFPTGYQVTTNFPFATSFSAVMACQNAATAFNPAVQDLLRSVVSHPDFSRLASR